MALIYIPFVFLFADGEKQWNTVLALWIHSVQLKKEQRRQYECQEVMNKLSTAPPRQHAVTQTFTWDQELTEVWVCSGGMTVSCHLLRYSRWTKAQVCSQGTNVTYGGWNPTGVKQKSKYICCIHQKWPMECRGGQATYCNISWINEAGTFQSLCQNCLCFGIFKASIPKWETEMRKLINYVLKSHYR